MEEKYNESEALLTVKDLKMHFPFAEGGLFSRKKGAIRAVDGISFSVKKGETLFAIAKRYHTTVEKIKRANNLKSDSLKIGQKLKIKK